jgi:hypothetical protein
MAVDITISGNVISFPTSGEDPNWAPAITEFAQAVEDALSTVSGQFDVTPQVYTMVANVNTNVDLPNLSFSTTNVRGAFVQYSVYRTASSPSATAYESGNLILIYTGSSWEVSRDFVGDGSITFNVTNGGQIQFSSTVIGGGTHTGKISYTARALLQS